MSTKEVEVTTAQPLLDLLGSGVPVALTGPLALEDAIMVGYCSSASESGACAVIPVAEASELGSALYEPWTAPIAVHGLKRIWEALQAPHAGTRELHLDLVHDTKLMAYLLDPDAGDRGLALSALAAEYLGKEYPHRIMDIRAYGYPAAFYRALARDAELIGKLNERLWPLMSPALQKLYRRLELPLMLVLDDMRRLGVGVDGYTCTTERARVAAQLTQLGEAITQGQTVNLSSDEEVFRFLVAHGVRFGTPFVYTTRKVSKEALEEIAYAYPVVQQLLEWRDLEQDFRFLKRASGQVRVHPIWRQTRVRTSRISAIKPAVQNVSRERRRFFIPAPGCVVVKADYAQAQLRILAHLSADENLMAVFHAQRDPHGETAAWLGIDRDSAKQVNFGICFGMSPAGLAGRLTSMRLRQGGGHVDAPTAQAYIDAFYERYPGVKTFFAAAWRELTAQRKADRVAVAPSGRIRRFDTRATRAVERKFRITWPQQIEADMIKTAIVRLDRIFRRRNMQARIVMMIHDALWVESPAQEAVAVKHLVRRMMTTAAKLRVPLEVDIK